MIRLSNRLPRAIPRQQVRGFSQTRTRPVPVINEVLDVASSFVHGVHDISHLPWALSLPLTAFIVRMGVALPLQIFTKVQARKDGDLAPILMAWREVYQKKALEKNATEGPLLPSQVSGMVKENLRVKHAELRRRWGIVRFWKVANFFQMPIWIAVMESIRAMSGNDRGLVPYLLSLLGSSEPGVQHLAVEPSLATEGALWFPDLLAGDPTATLPIILAASILLNVHNGWKATSGKEIAELPRLLMLQQTSFLGLRKFVQVLALNVGYTCYTYEMPAALMIYWITSLNIATLQTFLLQKYMFPIPPVKPKKRLHVGLKQPEKQDIAQK